MDLQRIGIQIRDFAISFMIVILIPYFIRYGMRAFIGPVEFPVWPFIGLGFIILSYYTENIFLSLVLLVYGAMQFANLNFLFMGSSVFGYDVIAFDQWLVFVLYAITVSFLCFVLYQHDRYEYDRI